MPEWGRAIEEQFPHWEVQVSPRLIDQQYDDSFPLFPKGVPKTIRVQNVEALHLDVSLRAYRAEQLSQWVSCVLERNPKRAKNIAGLMDSYPLFQTRSLADARTWLKKQQRGTRRIGIIASSGARRLRADGINVYDRMQDVENWFLNSPEDIRSSYYLEIAAREYDIQGLELDWTCLCWGLDLVPGNTDWEYRKFSGTKWQTLRAIQDKRYWLNKYRVLLTRAREGMMIYIPPGNHDDPTRPPSLYNAVADYLQECGVHGLSF